MKKISSLPGASIAKSREGRGLGEDGKLSTFFRTTQGITS